MLPLGVDAAYEMGQGLMPSLGNLSQATPKVIFDADTSRATSNLIIKDFMAMPPGIGNIRRLAALL
jgi:hypothetical protein